MSTNANVKVELLDKPAKALTELIKKQETENTRLGAPQPSVGKPSEPSTAL